MEEQFDWSPSPPSSPLSPESPLSPLDESAALSSCTAASSTTTYSDSQGLPVTVSASLSVEVAGEVIDCVNQYMEQVLTYGNSWHVIHRATLLDPHCLLALVLTADYLIAAEHIDHATRYLSRAKQLLTLSGNQHSHVTRREQLYVTAWTEWVRGKKHALTTLRLLIELCPNDLFAIKKAQLIAFLSGDFPRMLSLVNTPAVRAACNKRAYYGGMVAFALEENGEVEEAERVAREGVALCETDVWSYHAVAHCLLAQGRIAEGRAWMEANCWRWERCMSFMYTHSWFHAALFYLEDEDWPQVQHAYEQHIWRIDSQPTASRSSSASDSPSGHVHVSPAIEERPPIAKPHEEQKADTTEAVSVFQPFLSSDKGKIEDQLNALLVLWKWQVRCSSAGQASAPTATVDFAAYYRELISYVRWPPSQTLGLFGLVLLQACVSGHDEAKASELRQAMQQRVDAMEGGKQTKHVALYLPIADAVMAYYGRATDAAGGGRQSAYQLLAPIMSTYHRWLHRSERKHAPHTASSPAPPATAAPSGGSQRVSWQSAAFPWSGRHLLQVVVGSGEQRSVLSDWWLQLLYDTRHHADCEREAEQWLMYRRSEGSRFYRRMRDESRARQAAASGKDTSASGLGSGSGVELGGGVLQQ